MIKFQDNRQMSGGKDGQTLFHRIPPATARGPTSTTAVYWHLKVKNKMCNVGLIKNYSIKVSMQKISSIHKLIQQILVSHKLMTTPIFDQARVSHSGGGGMGGPSYDFFWKSPPSKPMPPMGCTPHLKMKLPHLKNTPPPIETWSTLPWNDS